MKKGDQAAEFYLPLKRENFPVFSSQYTKKNSLSSVKNHEKTGKIISFEQTIEICDQAANNYRLKKVNIIQPAAI